MQVRLEQKPRLAIVQADHIDIVTTGSLLCPSAGSFGVVDRSSFVAHAQSPYGGRTGKGRDRSYGTCCR
jgi:hypothetical protein